ncbi:MAG: NADH-quinone oxidoreductase subunit J [Proteobacteria bacterium]|nr:NADH-quinone oxidoreductase subunit J [Pseudomonadota bacterium]
MEQVLFWICGVVSIVFAVMMILKRNPVHSALCLIVVFLCLAVSYLLLGAEFLAAVQVIVYAGAIMVLFLFVIMLLNLDDEVHSLGKPRTALITGSIIGSGLILLFLLTGGVFKALSGMRGAEKAAAGNTQAVAELLFTKYLLPFEVTSILLLAAIIGALVLAGKEG